MSSIPENDKIAHNEIIAALRSVTAELKALRGLAQIFVEKSFGVEIAEQTSKEQFGAITDDMLQQAMADTAKNLELKKKFLTELGVLTARADAEIFAGKLT